jgi:outer membrane protein OmpA-like peptidoglycan-associated protein
MASGISSIYYFIESNDMTHRRQQLDSEELNIWPSFTDLMSNAFMISMLIVLLLVIKIPTKPERIKKDPPIIEIQETKGFSFPSGSAQISPKLSEYLTTKLVAQIIAQVRDNQINVIEVIGHTDSQPNGVIAGNLDAKIEKVANNQLPLSALQASSNADLGLMRALAVVKILKATQVSSNQLRGVKFRAYSAGPLIAPRGSTANPQNDRRRRIEIRFTRDRQVTKVE